MYGAPHFLVSPKRAVSDSRIYIIALCPVIHMLNVRSHLGYASAMSTMLEHSYEMVSSYKLLRSFGLPNY
jgi:hypothetical protein